MLAERIAGFVLFAIVAVPLAGNADHPAPAPRLISTISVPGHPLRGFDIGWVDEAAERYYLADRSNKAVDIFDAEHGTFITRVGGLRGATASNDFAGPNGVVAIGSLQEVWAGDGDSTVKVIDVRSSPPQIVATISTGGTARADEMAFDERDHLLLVANDADDPPFVSLISTQSREVVGKIIFKEASNGLEQPVSDPATQLFYLSVPELNGDPHHGEIAVIEPRSMSIVDAFPVSECEPAGLVLGPDQHLLVGCSQDAIAAGFAPKTLVLAARAGGTVATITHVGVAAPVWVNKGHHRYYLAGRGIAAPVLGGRG